MTIVSDPGDTVVAYTDGVTEARNDRDFFGEHALEAVIVDSEGAPAAITQNILEAAVAFQGNDPRDDIAVVAMTVMAPIA